MKTQRTQTKLNKSLSRIRVLLLVNLGSPQNLSVQAIKNFLSSFLIDKRVVQLPRFFWLPLLYGLILPFRSKKLIKQYEKIWIHSVNQSPLIHYTKLQSQLLQERLCDKNVQVLYAFSYSEPSIQNILNDLHTKYLVEAITIVPLFPQYSSTTTSTIFDQITNYYKNKYYLTNIKFIHSFYKHPLYIRAISESIQTSFIKYTKGQKLVFSFHSLPVKLIMLGDTYYNECLETAKLIACELKLQEDQWIVAFQSKFGTNKWLTPSTAGIVKNLALSGLTHIDIVCPGFVSDCLETLEEIAIMNKNLFIQNGGKKYTYIPCLNNNNNFINLLENLYLNGDV